MEAQNPGQLPPERAKAVVDYLVKEATDQASDRKAYAENARAAMIAKGLTEREADLLLTKNLNAIRTALGPAEFGRIVWHPPTVWQ